MKGAKFEIIAEIGQAHEGSLGIAHSYIDSLAKRGVDAVKFQTHIADAESSIYEPFRIKFSYEDKHRIDYWRRMEFTEEQWIGLKEHCDRVGLEFLSSPFSIAAVDLLDRIGVNRYKIGSGEVTNFLMLERIARTGKAVLLSTGMSSFSEIDDSIAILKNRVSEICLFQCTTSYPTVPENWGLNVIRALKNRYGLRTGFSDHSGDIFACLLASAYGAELFEFHVVFDKEMFGPDSKSSLTLNQLECLVDGLRQHQIALNNEIDKNQISQYSVLKQIFGKTLAVNRKLEKGHRIQIEDLETKKPKGFGISADQFQQVLGKQLKNNLNQWDFLKFEDIDE